MPRQQRNPSSTPPVWTAADLIDLELLVSEDEKAPQGERERQQERDRQIFLEVQKVQPDATRRRAAVFRLWLEQRRPERFRGSFTPGDEAASLLRWLQFGLLLLGLVAARGAVWSFFRGTGSTGIEPEPINVYWFGFVCLLIPLLLTIYGFWVLLGNAALPSLPRAPAFFRGLLLDLLRPWLRRIARRIASGTRAEARLGAQALYGTFRQRLDARRDPLSAYLFCAAQMFGLAFTLGVLLFAWIDVRFHSRVFGWQTTHAGTTAETVHKQVRMVAAPWAWLRGEGRGYPSLEQVRETRFIRHRDPALFPPEAAQAWASFLIAAALVYGALPRALLYGMSRWRTRRAFASIDFHELRFEPLWNRLARERVHWSSPPHPTSPPASPEGTDRTSVRADWGRGTCVLLVPSDLNRDACVRRIRQMLEHERGWRVSDVIAFESDPSSSHSAAEQVARRKTGRGARLILVQEAFMPPVAEVLRAVQELRQAAGPQGALLIGLLGKPGEGALGQPPKSADVHIWRQKVLSLGDAQIDVTVFREAG